MGHTRNAFKGAQRFRCTSTKRRGAPSLSKWLPIVNEETAPTLDPSGPAKQLAGSLD